MQGQNSQYAFSEHNHLLMSQKLSEDLYQIYYHFINDLMAKFHDITSRIWDSALDFIWFQHHEFVSL